MITVCHFHTHKKKKIDGENNGVLQQQVLPRSSASSLAIKHSDNILILYEHTSNIQIHNWPPWPLLYCNPTNAWRIIFVQPERRRIWTAYYGYFSSLLNRNELPCSTYSSGPNKCRASSPFKHHLPSSNLPKWDTGQTHASLQLSAHSSEISQIVIHNRYNDSKSIERRRRKIHNKWSGQSACLAWFLSVFFLPTKL